jgi:hypothetical protein
LINFENNREKLIQEKIFQEINKYTSLIQKNESQILNLENEMKRKNNLAKNKNSKLEKMPCLCSTRISEDVTAIKSYSFKNNQKELYHIKNGTNNAINLEGVLNCNIFTFIRSIASRFQKSKKPSADIIPKTSKPCITKR